MTVDEAKIQLGLRYDSELARALGLSRQSVNAYRRAGTIPKDQSERIELRIIKRQEAATEAQQAGAAQG